MTAVSIRQGKGSRRSISTLDVEKRSDFGLRMKMKDYVNVGDLDKCCRIIVKQNSVEVVPMKDEVKIKEEAHLYKEEVTSRSIL